MNANWVNELYIGTAESQGTWTYAKLCEGIESMEFNENEQNQQYFFLCGNGFAHNTSVKIIAEGKQIICDATVGAITTFGGSTLDVNAFGCTIRFNGEPTVTDAT